MKKFTLLTGTVLLVSTLLGCASPNYKGARYHSPGYYHKPGFHHQPSYNWQPKYYRRHY